MKESEKKDKYLNLARELKNLWKMKVTVIPIAIGALGTITKGLLKGLEDLEMRGWVVTIQTTVWLKSARILRRVMETWGDLLSHEFLWETISKRVVLPWYNYTYTNTRGNIINNNDEQTQFLRKIYLSHFILERFAKGLCVRGKLETEQTATYWPQVPLTIAALLSHSAGLLNRGSLRAASHLS